MNKQNIYTSEDCLKLAVRLSLGQVHFQEMNAYLPWHDRMAIDDADRCYFFDHFPQWAAAAKAGGITAICQLAEPQDKQPTRTAICPRTATPENIAAVAEVPIATIPEAMALSEIGDSLEGILSAGLPHKLVALVEAIRISGTKPALVSGPSVDIGEAIFEERERLHGLIAGGHAKMPHCLSTYAQILVNEDGTTRPCCRLQSRLCSIESADFDVIRNSHANLALRKAHAKQNSPRGECVDCRDPLRFHFLAEMLAELKADGMDISRIKKPEDFPVPASMADNEFVREFGSNAFVDMSGVEAL